MINKLTINNFKIHSNTELELSNLNILTGINGVGKSSVFQSLLLLRQSYEANVLSTGLQLNKPYCDIDLLAMQFIKEVKQMKLNLQLKRMKTENNHGNSDRLIKIRIKTLFLFQVQQKPILFLILKIRLFQVLV